MLLSNFMGMIRCQTWRKKKMKYLLATFTNKDFKIAQSSMIVLRDLNPNILSS